ncbi:MAG: FAD-dependent oxidoreductase, partial [Thermodesulfovibrionales bacterium]|nr:FAD-dependent oxidoreductase [Thermodesulfovibrionales bacterium]
MNIYDVAIIGAGHAGCEAAYAAARLGMKTLLITLNIDNIALMPCAPAVGGVGKGHLVKEIDAFNGLMGYITDMSALQYKTLNTSKGLAVHSTRAQVDKHQYKSLMRTYLENINNIHIRQALITEILIKNGKVYGLKDNFGFTFNSHSVIIATGTFLSGLIHIGDKTLPAGRAGEFPSYELPQFLRSLGLKTGRFKTGTGPRLKASSIDFSQMEQRYGDGKPKPFSYRTRNIQYIE